MKLSKTWQTTSNSFPKLIDAQISSSLVINTNNRDVEFYVYDANGARFRLEMTAQEIERLYKASKGDE